MPVVIAMVAGMVLLPALPAGTRAQDAQAGAGKRLYDDIQAFALTGGSADVSNLTLKRDRVEMTFNGTFYFAAPAAGTVTGAVFMGQGTMRARRRPATSSENVKPSSAATSWSPTRTAVLRFTRHLFLSPPDGRKAVWRGRGAARHDTDTRLLQEVGANLPARLAAALVNADSPGVFFAQFDGGRRQRFAYLLDHQGRIPVASFGLNGGEKGIIYQYESAVFFADRWMAFLAEDDYAKPTVAYSDVNDVVDVTAYQLNLDVRRVPLLSIAARIDMTVRKPNVRAVSFNIGESLSASQKMRLDNQLRVKRVRLGDGELNFAQEDWEGGFTVFLPKPAQANETVQLSIDLEGNFIQILPAFDGCYYPFDNVTWLPRHGYLDRATFDMTIRHRKRDKIAAVGTRLSELPDPDDPQGMITKYRMTHPVALVTFAIGPFERKTKQVTFEGTNAAIPLEFNSVPDRVLSKTNVVGVNSDLILDEMDNAVRYFSAMFGPYPYESFGGAFHPFGYGQGLATLLMVPPATRGRESNVFSFFAHETSHQWWGNIVAWRSYRDQWLSEGFAEYSGLLYAAKRTTDANKTTMELLRDMRQSLLEVPRTLTGAGKGRLNDIGPIVLGSRLQTSKTLGAYQALIYGKGALVLRMLHFLLSNPTTGSDAAFVAMMKDFVDQKRNGAASTDDFRRIASLHFARTPIAGKFEMLNLDWFFKQWVYGTGLPSYQLEYETTTRPDGSLFVTGVVKQTGVDPDFQMVLPLVMSFEGNQVARTTVRAKGPSTPFEIKVPIKPMKVELDPFNFVLSEKTSSRGK
jgi:hypothetical protein